MKLPSSLPIFSADRRLSFWSFCSGSSSFLILSRHSLYSLVSLQLLGTLPVCLFVPHSSVRGGDLV
jgi:hypothetical protein